ncbi:MAG TPA: hypothetical protein PKL15_19290, partial [Saprospiraceae bacterium]|nr:hypothetical protein [Saprospiraceae bacterium]
MQNAENAAAASRFENVHGIIICCFTTTPNEAWFFVFMPYFRAEIVHPTTQARTPCLLQPAKS